MRYLLVGVCAAIAVAGCGGAKQDSTPAQSTPAQSAPAPKVAAAPTPAPTITTGVYYFKAARDNQVSCADIGSENVKKGEGNIHRFTCNNTVYQQWQIAADPDRPNRYLMSYAGGGDKFWEGEGRKPSANYVKFTKRNNNAYQAWRITPYGDGTYAVANDGNARCLDYNFNTNQIENLKISDCAGQPPEQHWYLTPR